MRNYVDLNYSAPIKTFQLTFDILTATIMGKLFVSYGTESSIHQLWNKSGIKLAEFGTLSDDGITCNNSYKRWLIRGFCSLIRIFGAHRRAISFSAL